MNVLNFIKNTLEQIDEIKLKLIEIQNNIEKEETNKDIISYKCLEESDKTLDMFTDRYRKDKNFVKIALEKNSENIIFVDESILDSFGEFIKEILQKDGLKLEKFPDCIKENEEYCYLAIKQNYEALKFVKNKRVINDKPVILKLVENNGLLLEFVSDELKKDFEIIISAVSNNSDAKKFISPIVKEKIIGLFS